MSKGYVRLVYWKMSPYVIPADVDEVLVDASRGSVVLILSAGREVTVRREDSSQYDVTIRAM